MNSASLVGMSLASAAAMNMMSVQHGKDVYVIRTDDNYDPRSELQKTADQITEHLTDAEVRRSRQPNPEVQAKAAAKRARKAARLKAWADKGVIGVQVAAEIQEAPVIAAKTVRKRPAAKTTNGIASVAPKVESSAKKKAPAKKPAAAPAKKAAPAAKKPKKAAY